MVRANYIDLQSKHKKCGKYHFKNTRHQKIPWSYFKGWVGYRKVPTERSSDMVSAPREDTDHSDKKDEELQVVTYVDVRYIYTYHYAYIICHMCM